MKTTLVLPDDVIEVLRLESARRGGRKAASLSSLVACAVREVYGTRATRERKCELKPGRVVIGALGDRKNVDSEDVAAALYDEVE